tara:strand:+ start:441 stop:1142 length:702 start_codon:yes stop_codon:yes gene_type:complete
MNSSNYILEAEKTDKDPSLSKFKDAVKNLSVAAVDAAKTSEGKNLPTEYWLGVVKLVKKAKLGISMIDLGIDDLDAVEDTADSDELELKKTGPIQKMDSAEPTTSDSSESSTKKPTPSPKKKTDDSDDSDDSEDDEDEKSTTSNEYYDTLNHFGILLSERNFDSVECVGAKFNIKKSDRNFTIKYADKFYLLSENYNFELGDNYDLQEVIETFVKLSKHSETELRHDYRSTSS